MYNEFPTILKYCTPDRFEEKCLDQNKFEVSESLNQIRYIDEQRQVMRVYLEQEVEEKEV